MRNFKISPHTARTLIWWYNRRGEIDFDPPYQRRGRLWSAADKAYLIDSIINGFDVPKLYLADFQFGQSSLNKAKLPYAIIDGKQRLEAVFDFFENKLILNEDCTFRKDPNLKIGGLSLKDLRKSYGKVAEEFENASLDIMSVHAEDEADINEIFVRLNKSKPLTGAEVRNAVAGPVSELARLIASHAFFVENIKFSVARAADLNAGTKLLLFEYEEKQTATKKVDLDRFAKSDVDRSKLELAGRRALDTLSAMSDIFIPRDPLLSSAGMVPVYYWFIRDLSGEAFWSARRFLLQFETMRKVSRGQHESDLSEDMLRLLARFETLNRSTNDLQSHVGRVQILHDALRIRI